MLLSQRTTESHCDMTYCAWSTTTVRLPGHTSLNFRSTDDLREKKVRFAKVAREGWGVAADDSLSGAKPRTSPGVMLRDASQNRKASGKSNEECMRSI